MIKDALVKDMMETDVYQIRPDMNLADAMRYLIEKKVSAAPIINDAGTLMGIISDGDIVKYLFRIGRLHDALFAESIDEVTGNELTQMEELIAELQEANVMDLATTSVVSVHENDTYDEAGRVLGKKPIKKVPVLNDDGQVVGVLSRSNITRYLFGYSLKMLAQKNNA